MNKRVNGDQFKLTDHEKKVLGELHGAMLLCATGALFMLGSDLRAKACVIGVAKAVAEALDGIPIAVESELANEDR